MIDMGKKTPIEQRILGKRVHGGYPITSLPDIFADELTMNDSILVSHDNGVEQKFSSHQIKLSELIRFIQANI
jgi:hypothetical protein